MTPEELMAIMKVASLTDSVYIKTDYLELRRGTLQHAQSVPEKLDSPIESTQTPVASDPEPPLDPEKEKEIAHKIEEMDSLMKVSDADLIDRLFPLPEDPEGGS